MKRYTPRASSFTFVVFCVATLASAQAGVARAQSTATVPGTANIFGAGHAGAAATPAPSGQGGGTAPPSISVVGVAMLTFPSISGTVDFGGTAGPYGPDGQAVTAFTFGSFNGISGFSADRNTALFGVFTGSTEPANPAPPSLNFTGNTSFAALSPLLNQTFFIGDGLTGTTSGVPQEFVVPTGATQLYLGLADSGGSSEPFLPGGYFNNTGSFEVQVSPVPEPGSCLLVAVMASIGSIYLRRWRERPNQVLQQTAGA